MRYLRYFSQIVYSFIFQVDIIMYSFKSQVDIIFVVPDFYANKQLIVLNNLRNLQTP